MLVQGCVTDNAPRPHQLPGQLKLRLDQRQDANSVLEKRQEGWKKRLQRDKRGVDHGQIKGFGNMCRRYIAGVGALKHNNAFILSQFPV